MKNVTGTVIQGNKRGHKLGFPTANIKVGVGLDAGIYAGRIVISEKTYHAALYSAGDDTIEAFILDFSGDLYGETVGIEVVKKIRDKKDFKNDVEAAKQIAEDVVIIKNCLQSK